MLPTSRTRNPGQSGWFTDRHGRRPSDSCRPASCSGPARRPTRSRARPTRTARAPSIWDTFTARPGTVKDGSSGEVACDHYHRYVEDVALMKRARRRRLPVLDRLAADPARRHAVRPTRGAWTSTTGSSTSWSAAGIEPMATLYHWDLPQALQDAGGGWAGLRRDRGAVRGVRRRSCADRLGDRVAALGPGQRAQRGHPAGPRDRRARAGPDARVRARCRWRTT